MEEKHFSHHHPLKVLENIDHESLIFSCCFKGGYSPSDQGYGCMPCRYFIHRSCSELPSEIHHFYHLGHVLRLCAQNTEQATCGACGKQYYGLSYRCTETEEEHSFNMDIECALLPDKLKQDDCDIDYVQHSSHGHPLVMCDDNETKEKLCSGCNKSCSGKIYGCLRCDIFLDEACLLLPHRIGHPFHPSHSLTLTFRNAFECNGCKQTYHRRLSYSCSDSCDFNMDLECASLTPTIQFEGHDHLLTLFRLKREYPDLDCNLCHKRRNCYNLAFFRCVDCDYSLHLLCGPLPRKIQDQCHADPLKLMDYFVEDGYQADDVYCDTCEQIRDPEECVYYCKDCNFVSEFKCVLPEVLNSLEGRRGNVQLRSANEINSWVRGKVISNLCQDKINEAIEIDSESDIEMDFIQKNYSEIKFDQNPLDLHIFTGEEVDQVSQIFKRAGVNLRYFKYDTFPAEVMPKFRYIFNQLQATIVDGSHRNEEANSDMDNDDVVEEDYKQFIEKLNSSRYVDEDYVLNLLKVNYNVVKIGELMVIEELGSILKGLLYKHGDFTSKSKLNQTFKMIFTTIFCKVVRSMCITNIREVDSVLLQKWWKSIKLVEYAGFEIQFMIDHLYKVVQASFELQKQVEVTKLQVQYDQITCKVEKLQEELKASKRDLEVIKSKLDEYKVLGYRRSPKIKECLEYASEMKWKKAWNASPIMFRNFRYNLRRRVLRPQCDL